MDKPRATLKDIAEESGYSVRTVKKVMSGTENVSEKTRLSILRASEKLNYQRNILASTLSKQRSARIAIVYSETTRAYFPEVERGFRECAEEYRDYGLSIEFHILHDRRVQSQDEILRELAKGQAIDGLIIQPISRMRLDPLIDDIADAEKPVITFGADATSAKRLCYIGPNAYKSGRIGAQILANYIGKTGNVVIISDNLEHMQTVDRIRGFNDRVREHYPNIRITNINIPSNPELYYDMVKALVTKDNIQGIFCTDANSYIAGEVLRDHGTKDIAVVGFDISEIAAELMKQGFLKVIIEQNPYQFSYMALKTMFNYLYLGIVPKPVQYTSLSILTSECIDSD